jgi:hypothetical protein
VGPAARRAQARSSVLARWVSGAWELAEHGCGAAQADAVGPGPREPVAALAAPGGQLRQQAAAWNRRAPGAVRLRRACAQRAGGVRHNVGVDGSSAQGGSRRRAGAGTSERCTRRRHGDWQACEPSENRCEQHGSNGDGVRGAGASAREPERRAAAILTVLEQGPAAPAVTRETTEGDARGGASKGQ